MALTYTGFASSEAAVSLHSLHRPAICRWRAGAQAGRPGAPAAGAAGPLARPGGPV